jgi:hypothetical protein
MHQTGGRAPEGPRNLCQLRSQSLPRRSEVCTKIYDMRLMRDVRRSYLVGGDLIFSGDLCAVIAMTVAKLVRNGMGLRNRLGTAYHIPFLRPRGCLDARSESGLGRNLTVRLLDKSARVR